MIVFYLNNLILWDLQIAVCFIYVIVITLFHFSFIIPWILITLNFPSHFHRLLNINRLLNICFMNNRWHLKLNCTLKFLLVFIFRNCLCKAIILSENNILLSSSISVFLFSFDFKDFSELIIFLEKLLLMMSSDSEIITVKV